MKKFYISHFLFSAFLAQVNQLKSPIPQIVLLAPKNAIVYQAWRLQSLTDSSKVAWLGTELTTKTHFGSLRAQSGNLKIDKDGESSWQYYY